MVSVAQLSPWRVRCGIATYMEGLAGGLAEHGVEVYVVRLHRWGRKDETYYRWYASRVPKEAEILHCQMEYGLYGARTPRPMECAKAFYEALVKHRKPVVTTMHSTGMVEIDRIVEEASDRVIVHNQYQKNLFKGECVVVPHGCTPSEPLQEEEAKRKLGLEGKVVTIFGFVGPYKGVEVAIDAVADLPDVTLLVAGGWHLGTTEYIEDLKRLAEEKASGRVRFTGWLPESELPTVFGASDVILAPYLFASESGSVLTALSYGRCVLARDLPPFHEKKDNGVLCVFKNRDSLVSTLRELLDDGGLRSRVFEKWARYYAESVSWNRVAKLHIELYEGLLK